MASTAADNTNKENITITYTVHLKQESLADAKVSAR